MRETLATILWEGWTALVLCAAAVFLPGSEALTYPAVLWPGDVYKRQGLGRMGIPVKGGQAQRLAELLVGVVGPQRRPVAVSYTHLAP